LLIPVFVLMLTSRVLWIPLPPRGLVPLLVLLRWGMLVALSVLFRFLFVGLRVFSAFYALYLFRMILVFVFVLVSCLTQDGGFSATPCSYSVSLLDNYTEYC
jgi:hypothetical protein